MIPLKVFFVENSLDSKILIKRLVSCQLLYRVYSLKLKSLSITTPNNFYFELSEIFTSPIRAQEFSCLHPETNE